MRLVLICQSPYSHDISFRLTNNVGGTSQEWEDAFVKLCCDLDNREVVPRLRRELGAVSEETLAVLQRALQLGGPGSGCAGGEATGVVDERLEGAQP